MPILGGRLFEELDNSRFCCITGSLSYGKTRLAVDMGVPYWRAGYDILMNIPHNFTPDGTSSYTTPSRLLYKTFNIADEGGEYVRKASLASTMVRSAGKANYYFVFAGKRMPHKELQEIVVEGWFNFYQNYGLPLILWKASVNASKKYAFTFWQWLPSVIHGTYSTRTSSGGIEILVKNAEDTVKHLAFSEGQVAGVQQNADLASFGDDLASATGDSLGEWK